MSRDIITVFFDDWLSRSPDGHRFSQMPWELDWFTTATELPFYRKPYKVPTPKITWSMIAITVVSILLNYPLPASLGAGFLVLLFLSCKEAWEQSGALLLTVESTKVTAHEREEFGIRFRAQNKSSKPLNRTYLFVRFPGAIHKYQVFCLPRLDGFEERTIEVKFFADGGMGTYKVPEISVVTRDFFGFVPRCVPHPIDCEVEVVPEYATMPPLRISVAGKTSHSGSVDARISGESTNFLGLRGFRHGDSIRRIDWKKSEKCGGLIVREFERLNSTDATIIIDQRQISHFEYEELNSFEVLKDTAVALCRSLMDQRIRVQFITRDYVLDFGKGAHFFDHLVELVRDLRPNSAEPFEDFVHRHRELVPPDSVVIPLFAAVDLKIDSLLETFWTWDMVRAEVIPVLIDVNSFDRKIASRAKVDTQEQENLRAVREMYGDLSGHKPYESLARKISAKSILIGPDETIGEVYARSSPWGR